MARRDHPSSSEINASEPIQPPASDFAILQELETLQDILYDGFHLPLTPWSIVDEGKVQDQLEVVHGSVPSAVQKALRILEQGEEIIAQAREHADHIVQNAQQQAARLLDESGIIQQAEQQAYQIRRQVQQECEAMQQQTLAEVAQMQQSTQQELQQFRQQTLTECGEMHDGADRYADGMLSRLERDLGEMLSVVRNGRQQLYSNSPSLQASTKSPKPSPNAAHRRPPQP